MGACLARRPDRLRDAYRGAVSPKTGAAYATGTIANRMAAIMAFYAYAGEHGWRAGPIRSPAVLTDGASVPLDRDALTHVRRGRRLRDDTDLLPRRRPNRTAVRAFSAAELRAFLPELGPRASERGPGDLRPSRDRLIGDLGVFVGLRIDEIHQLTKYQFLSLLPDPEAPYADQPLTVVGKGHVGRTVAVPNWLVQDALAYVGGERAEAVRAGRLTGRKEPPDVFVAGRDSNVPGRPVTHRRFQQIVEEACIRAGVVEIVRRVDPETREVVEVAKAKHCVHDLRHTYAVLMYWAEKHGGNAEPWKKIQAQLGHRHLEHDNRHLPALRGDFRGAGTSGRRSPADRALNRGEASPFRCRHRRQAGARGVAKVTSLEGERQGTVARPRAGRGSRNREGPF